MKMKKKLLTTLCASAMTLTGVAQAAEQPNILVIFGDDIGYGNLSAYNNGMLGYQTPNIDRIANSGAKFTSYYAQQSCTAGRSAFITGQMPMRTGLTKVGMPGAKAGIQPEDLTMATALKDLGYNTGQFGKNHLGDRDEHLPTNHGFDEFLGNLYHLNAEEEPENEDYPTDPEFAKKYGPRGVIKSFADGSIEDTGPLTRKRMETIDDETLEATKTFIEKSVKEDKPFFAWYNTTRMHSRTHVQEQNRTSGLGEYADGMIEHDIQIGMLLDKVEELGIDENTIIVYTTDNGPMTATWPDGAHAPFRGEKNTGWEGGFRVPAMISWKGHIEPNQNFNGIIAGEDWLPTLLAAAGNTTIKEDLLKGYTSEYKGYTYNNHLDGYNLLPYLTGETKESPRNEFFYWSDDGDLLAVRDGRFKMHFKVQRAEGFDVWMEEFDTLRVPLIFDLENDPYEKGDVGTGYQEWLFDRLFLLSKAQGVVGEMLQSLYEYPPRQEIGSFTVGKAIDEMKEVQKAADKAKAMKN